MTAGLSYLGTGRKARGSRLPDPVTLVALGVVLFMIVVGLLAAWIAPYDPLATSWSAVRAGPSAAHWFGADELGRDVLSRIIYGARVSIFVGLVTVAIAATMLVVWWKPLKQVVTETPRQLAPWGAAALVLVVTGTAGGQRAQGRVDADVFATEPFDHIPALTHLGEHCGQPPAQRDRGGSQVVSSELKFRDPERGKALSAQAGRLAHEIGRDHHAPAAHAVVQDAGNRRDEYLRQHLQHDGGHAVTPRCRSRPGPTPCARAAARSSAVSGVGAGRSLLPQPTRNHVITRGRTIFRRRIMTGTFDARA